MKDIAIDETGDLLIVNGDIAIGDADATDIDLLMGSFKGEWKESPLTGIEAVTMLKKRNGIARLKKESKQQLRENGFSNVKIVVQGDDINIDAERI